MDLEFGSTAGGPGRRRRSLCDPRDRVLDAYELVDGAYELRARLTDDEIGDIPFGIATAHANLAELLC